MWGAHNLFEMLISSFLIYTSEVALLDHLVNLFLIQKQDLNDFSGTMYFVLKQDFWN
jgi:hypothetical protein